MSGYYWRVDSIDKSAVEILQESLHISELLASILVRRGITSPGEARLFLYGGQDDLQPPREIPGLIEAADLIRYTLAQKERIVIYGDYDVDGVCSTVILLECLQAMGAEVSYYIPDRFEEGYGLNCEAIKELARQEARLLITVDCGINAVKEIELARSLGIEVIITDHHTPESLLPEAAAIVNPRLGAPDVSRDLCGAGVAFKLAQQLSCGQNIDGMINSWMELAALATVADIVPLTGENRILVKEGLREMKRTRRYGLRALLDESRIALAELSAWHLGFMLAPRINAAGRLARADLGVSLLLAADASKAQEIARELCLLNEERKSIEQSVFEQAACCIEQMEDLDRCGILVIDGDNWHQGVLGIAASRLAERYRLPIVLVSWEGNTGRGSARSIPGFNLYEALHSCQEWLERFGGHDMAAGLSLNREQAEAFRSHLQNQAVINQPADTIELSLDGVLPADQLFPEMVHELELLQPFGQGNPAPRFLIGHDIIQWPTLMGSNREHFRAKVQPGNLSVIGFRHPEWVNYPFSKCRFDLISQVEIDTYQNRQGLRLKALDLIPVYKNRVWLQNPLWQYYFDRILKSLQAQEPVVFVAPTLRVLSIFGQIMAEVFADTVLCPLHGCLPKEERLTATRALSSSQPKLYLTTRACWHYLKKHGVQINPDIYVVQFWPTATTDAEISDAENNLDQSSLLLELNQDPRCDGKHTLLYITEPETRQKIEEQLSEYVTDRNRLYITAAAELASRLNQKIDQVILADPPYSVYEAQLLKFPLNNHRTTPVQVCFGPGQFKLSQKRLQDVYPERKTIRPIYSWLRLAGQQGFISGDIDTMANEVSNRENLIVSGRQLLGLLQILSDLGLCQYRKKGSIIEIKMQSSSTTTWDLADSPYYLEGQAEKRALLEWEQRLKKQFAW